MWTVGSLFSGTGLLDLGLEWAGWNTIWQVEIDPFRRGLLARRFPRAAQYGDVHDIDFGALPRVDLIAGGFPCTPISAAGKRRGRDDEHWLWPEFARAVRALRPRHVLVENSPRLLSPYRDDAGRWQPAPVEDVVADLDALGYVGEWDCIPAAAVGAPHERDRVWIVATHTGRARGRLQLERGPERGHQAEPLNDGPARPVAHAEGERREDRTGAAWRGSDTPQPERRSGQVADADGEGRRQFGEPGAREGRAVADSGGPSLADPDRPGRSVFGRRGAFTELAGLAASRGGGWWATEPDVGRVAHGSTSRLDRPRLRAIGDGVVPQVVEVIGRWLLEMQP
jgi:DNA (cytosine-5)-methyltransferase 1